LSFFQIPKKVKTQIDKLRKYFLWFGGNIVRKKYAWVAWNIVYKSKHQGSLGVLDLVIVNSSILTKWLVSINKSVENNITVVFWYDRWMLQITLVSAYHSLYSIVQQQNISSVDAFDIGVLLFTFTQTLIGVYLDE
jgi:hypothetical protein